MEVSVYDRLDDLLNTLHSLEELVSNNINHEPLSTIDNASINTQLTDLFANNGLFILLVGQWYYMRSRSILRQVYTLSPNELIDACSEMKYIGRLIACMKKLQDDFADGRILRSDILISVLHAFHKVCHQNYSNPYLAIGISEQLINVCSVVIDHYNSVVHKL